MKWSIPIISVWYILVKEDPEDKNENYLSDNDLDQVWYFSVNAIIWKYLLLVTAEYFEVNGMISPVFQGPVVFGGKENPSGKSIMFKHAY